MRKVRIEFKPMAHLESIAKGIEIEVREYTLDGQDCLGDFSVPVNDIIGYISNETTEILHSYDDVMGLIIVLDGETKEEWCEL